MGLAARSREAEVLGDCQYGGRGRRLRTKGARGGGGASGGGSWQREVAYGRVLVVLVGLPNFLSTVSQLVKENESIDLQWYDELANFCFII